MTYSVYQHWDPLKTMVVGKSYPPEVYNYIKNEKVRKVFYQIAEETEEDYQKLISLLESFGVQTVRPDMTSLIEIAKYNIKNNREIASPGSSMQPRDYSIMLGDTFYCNDSPEFKPIIDLVKSQGNKVVDDKELEIGQYTNCDLKLYMNSAMTTRLGKDLHVGTFLRDMLIPASLEADLQKKLPNYRVNVVDTRGHTDGSFCPVIPGLIISIDTPINYAKTFPDWEVVYLPGESWSKVRSFLMLKKKNAGKWWVPGEELNQDFTDYVETWMKHWVGYVEESVFDVNMIVVDKKNVIVNGYNQKVFDAFSRYGITPHVCNFRHRYFWDGGLHCITSDLHREGVMEDYFPERNIIV
jgi:hypothetical protein